MKKFFFLAVVAMALLTVSCSDDDDNNGIIRQYGEKPVKELIFTQGNEVVHFVNIYDIWGRLVSCTINEWHMKLVADYSKIPPAFHCYTLDDEGQVVLDDEGKAKEGLPMKAVFSNGKISSLSILDVDDEGQEYEEMRINYTYDANGKPIELKYTDFNTEGEETWSTTIFYTWSEGNLVSYSYSGDDYYYKVEYSDKPNKSGVIPFVIMNGMDAFSILGDFYFKNLPTKVIEVKANGDEEVQRTYDWELNSAGLPTCLYWHQIDPDRTFTVEFRY